MRLWSLHPKYLDTKGLVALWREGLLAQNVLAGNTKGYRNHPQLTLFKEHEKPLEAIGSYLLSVYKEAVQRRYKFNRDKILTSNDNTSVIQVTDGQLKFEVEYLGNKLRKRDPERLKLIQEIATTPDQHPLFEIIEGKIANWERI